MDRFEEIKTLERAKELFNDRFSFETRPKEHFVLPQLWAEGERVINQSKIEKKYGNIFWIHYHLLD